MGETEDFQKGADWCSSYMFWRRQYTGRNSKFLIFFKDFGYRLIGLKDKTGGNAEWFKWLLDDPSRDPVDYISNCPKEWTLTLDEMQEIKNMLLKWNKDFPYYVIYFIEPIEILNAICEGNFPPPSWNSSEDNEEVFGLYCGRRQKSVYPKGSDINGFEVVAIDCDAEVSVILLEVMRIIDKKKKNKSFYCGEDHINTMKNELSTAGSAYRSVSNESRAIGLMLYDYVFQEKCSDAVAIRWVKKELAERGPKNFGKADSSDRQFQRWLSKTRRCIESMEVLEI